MGEDEPLAAAAASASRRAPAGGTAGARAQRRRAPRRRLPARWLAEHEQSGAAATLVVAQVALAVRRRRGRGRTARSQASARRRCRSTGSTPASTPGRGSARAPARRRATTSSPPSRSSQASGGCTRDCHEGVWLTVNTPKDLRRAAGVHGGASRAGSRRGSWLEPSTRRTTAPSTGSRSSRGASRSLGAGN